MRGLYSTLPTLLDTASTADVLLLTETWLDPEETAPPIVGYQCISMSRPWKHYGAGRASGGLACYVKDHLSRHVKQWKKSDDASLLWLQFDKAVGFHKDLFLCLTYIWPEGATHYEHPCSINAFDTMTEDVAEIYSIGGLVLLAGDFNARTAAREDYILREVYEALLPDVPKAVDIPADIAPRRSCDTKHNNFGMKLLQLCQDANLLILNGRTSGDQCGQFTCHTSTGQSVVDYFIASPDLAEYDMRLNVQERMPESDHCPLTLAINTKLGQQLIPPQPPMGSPPRGSGGAQGEIPAPALSQPKRIRYTPGKESQFCHELSQSLQFHFGESSSQAPAPCYATAIQECIASAATSTFGLQQPRHQQHQHKPWYDEECKVLRRKLASLALHDPQHPIVSKAYKQLVKRKRRHHEQAAQLEICQLAITDSCKFWRRYKQRKSVLGAISPQEWKEAFEALVGATTEETQPTDQSAHSPIEPDAYDMQMNAPITEEDVQAAFKRLKRRKAAGFDGIKPEFLLDAEDLLLQPLTCTFNQMLSQGVPESWCMGVIHPIFKSGDENNPSNYRGITVTAILAKLFAMILEDRMSTWAESKQLRAAGQAGFRRDYRTVDNLFVLNSIIEQTKKHRGKKVYCCFVDFRKAFDIIPRGAPVASVAGERTAWKHDLGTTIHL